MRVILIDDEPLALASLEKLITGIDGVELIGTYINPQLGLEAILRDKPEVVFIDIEMPVISGIEIAERVQSEYLDSKIVFITGFSEYAVKAFELNAVDYLIKPVKHQRLNDTITRLKGGRKLNPNSSIDPGIVCCFSNLHFIQPTISKEIIEGHWRTSKAKEVFAYLIQHHDKPIRKDTLIELFWPTFDMEKGYAQLYSTIYQIRKTLESINFNIIITNYNNTYKLDLNGVKLDVEIWEQRTVKSIQDGKQTFWDIRNTLDIYKGDYLSEEGYIWAENERERLRQSWLQYVKEVTNFFIEKKEYTYVIQLYQRVQSLNPYQEETYFTLMRLFDLLGDRNAVEYQYKKLTKMLLEEYDMKLSSSIRNWYTEWRERFVAVSLK